MAIDQNPDAIDRPFKVGRLLFNADDHVFDFIKEHIGMDFEANGPFKAVGILDNDGLLVAGACYHDFFNNSAMFAGAASRGRKWATKNVMRGLFAHAFIALELHRLTALVDETNTQAVKWNLKAGFVEEGRLREAGKDESDVIVFGLLKSECRWINGQRIINHG